jgi:hypothetical protein
MGCGDFSSRRMRGGKTEQSRRFAQPDANSNDKVLDFWPKFFEILLLL